jgi:hypothetical protein
MNASSGWLASGGDRDEGDIDNGEMLWLTTPFFFCFNPTRVEPPKGSSSLILLFISSYP